MRHHERFAGEGKKSASESPNSMNNGRLNIYLHGFKPALLRSSFPAHSGFSRRVCLLPFSDHRHTQVAKDARDRHI